MGRPFGYFFGQNVAVYRGSDGNLRDVWWSDGLPGFEVLAAEGAPPLNPFAYFDSEGFQHVIYRGNDVNLHELYWSTGQPLDKNLTGGLVDPWLPDGNPQAYIAGGFHVAVYRGFDGHLHDVSWRNGVSPKHE